MQLMLEEVCQSIRNYFCDYYKGDVCTGEFVIEDGVISGVNGTKTPVIYSGMYYRIVGSRLNNGIFLAGTDTPVDEENFDGEVWLMRIPQSFIVLVEDIKAWQAKHGGADSVNMSPFSSESYGVYSYAKGTSYGGSSAAVTWQAQFASRLNAWRKI